MRKYGLVLGVATGAVLLAGCGGGGAKGAAAPLSPSITDSGAPTDSASPAASQSPTGKAAKTGKTTPATGPTVGPGAKCGKDSVVSGHITCAHVAKVFATYATKKTAKGAATFSGWTCHSKTTAPKSVTCSRSGVVIRSAA